MSPNKRKQAAHPVRRRTNPNKPAEPTPPKPVEPKPEEPPVQSLTDLPEGCNTEPYEGVFNESGEPSVDPGPGRTWYQGSDGRYYNCPQSGG